MKLTDDEIPNRCSIIYLRGGAQRRRDEVLPFPPDDRRVRTRRIPPGLFFGIVFLVLVFPSSSPSFWGVGLFVCHVVVAGGGVGVRHNSTVAATATIASSETLGLFGTVTFTGTVTVAGEMVVV